MRYSIFRAHQDSQFTKNCARRWQIENYFKVAKQYLQFNQTQIQNYDSLCGRMAMVMMSYVNSTREC
ncbi:transposase [Liquorilactobacillus sicerae]|uniref:transposase n=1 Tax=Liquorilactobacillus sicerae TaxID=1416943 RepID=UPI003D0920AE